MLRTAFRSAIKPRAPAAGAARRSASTVSETVGDAAQKVRSWDDMGVSTVYMLKHTSNFAIQVKDAASQASSGHHKPSSDVPWAVSVIPFFP